MMRPTKREESKLYGRGYSAVAGVDEVGRGAWAGPLVAAAVILPLSCRLPGLRDSKQLTPQQRDRLFDRIRKVAVCYSVSVQSNEAIDSSGIQSINIRALKEAVQGLSFPADCVLADRFGFDLPGVLVRGIIRGDTRIRVIAAASVLAKVTRDRMMERFHGKYPQFFFDRNKGYGTLQHHAALKKEGVCSLHRRSFYPMKQMVG